ncbi:MAG: TRAP transporter large permease subunit [Candidatus Tectomicrobia bacterium]|nr:TRAP transporter large permease subunit [Candidatus Tectomicrobia bacterium]
MDFLPLWMFVALFGLLFLGYPVAFTIGALAVFFGWIGFGLGFFSLLPLRIWGVMTNFTVVAVPMFVFMGVMLERSGLAEDLLETMAVLFGPLRGGLSIAVVVVGALLAASTGIVGATTVTMGLLALPTMLRRRYSPEIATGTIAASGTLGQIIPPSIVLVILGDIMGLPIGDLFMGAVVPGLVLVGLYLLFIVGVGLARPEAMPLLREEERVALSPGELAVRVMKSLVPPLFLMLAVLGSIFAGVASPTEASAMGALCSMLLAWARGKLDLATLRMVMRATTRLTSMVFIILVGATTFGLVFRGLGGDDLVRGFIRWIPYGKWGALTIVMLVLFVAGFFLDFIEITFIHVPVLAPLMAHLGFDPLWFAVLIAVNLQTSFLTPPFGYALFYLKSVAPQGVTTGHIYRGIVPFVALQLVGLALVILFPEMVLWLPRAVFGGR